ncbi:DUF2169 family type VI secretion system accessory protein [Aliikangiella coralliicola]|uniref:DUF2169 domain-containing protein n=1 Tax=Aliikangiella coralliicola TaxID=2592383 RepID=A0A545U905_9GAMM|nr:DUF2169 domain-containing protein [Aliikangiella coralliicola]TQV85893.1 DUF2169 domain-containing protein [Aliikangiella coralliicola]
MLQLKNSTPFAAEIAVFPNEQGVDTLYSIVKATFISGNGWTLADEQAPPQQEDEFWGEAGQSSIKLSSDFHTGKLATDIVMLGEACAPSQREVSQLDVHLSVGKVGKSARIFGDRFWHGGRISAPAPFTSMPLIYERAYGGRHDIDEHQYLAEERNPVGRGYIGKRSRSELNGSPLPNIENPNDLIASPSDKPAPTGYGFSAPNWLPRRQYAGTYDERWQKERAPYLPLDFDRRFLNAAHPDLIYPGFLQGGEPILVRNMHPDGDFEVSLPEVKVHSIVKLDGQKNLPEMNLESLILEPNKRQLSMVWKAAFACDKKVLNINEVEIKLSR